jgi:hypothetical protein
VEENGSYFITETQKDIARVHQIDQGLLEGLWNQFDGIQRTVDMLALDWVLENQSFPRQMEGIHISPFYERDPLRDDHGGRHMRSGFTIDIIFRLDDLIPGQILIDTRNESGKGFQLSTTNEETIRLALCDGRTSSTWDCDKGTIQAGRKHYLSVIIDGGPKIIMFVTDGILNDGGDNRQYGWGRFNPFLQDVNGADQWIIGKNLQGDITRIMVYNRALKISEAIGNYKYHINQ